MEQIIYPDLDAVLLLYKNGDLPQDQMAFPYRQLSGTTAWVHIDEIKRQLALREAYPQANTQKAQK